MKKSDYNGVARPHNKQSPVRTRDNKELGHTVYKKFCKNNCGLYFNGCKKFKK